MLDESEWELVGPLLSNTIQNIKEYRRQTGASLAEARKHHNTAALDKYFELTGYREASFDAIWHHRLSAFGPPCSHCGKLLRTPKAKFCAECGASAPNRPGLS
jgi:hypothetical protein